jgi:arylsulfatase A-like enzyme
MNMNRRVFIKTFAVSASVLVAQSSLKSVSAGFGKKPNIVFVLTDQWRAQATGYAGDPNVKTPNLDALASTSVNFVNAVSVCPVCTPYRASLMTGKYPLSTGMFLNDLYLPSEELCMAEIFNKAGYETGYIGKWHLDGHGRDAYIPRERRQGFDYWEVLECTHEYNESCYYADDDKTLRMWKGYDAYAQTEDARQYIREHSKKDNPFLLVMAYGGPHFPHHTAPAELKDLYPPDSIQVRPNVPDNLKKRASLEAQGYYAHCTALDRCVGDLQKTLEETGAADNTIFVFTSDHGEMLGSQGQPPCEKQRPWDESIRVPFLLRYPALTGDKGCVIKAPINTPDILPTLLALAGVAIPETIEGEDLSRLILGENIDEDRAALVMSVSPFAGYQKGRAYRGIRTSRYSYVCDTDGPWLMYDNQADPYQMKNLAGAPQNIDLQKELDDKLKARLKQTRDKFLSPQNYREEWDYKVDRNGNIPYFNLSETEGKTPSNFKVQSPAYKPKNED